MSKLNLFVFFPENEEELESQFGESLPKAIEDYQKILPAFVQRLKKCSHQIKYDFFYDAENIKASKQLLASLEVGNINTIAIFLQDFKNIASKYIRPTNGIAYNQYVNFCIEPVADIIQEVAERKLFFSREENSPKEEYFILDLMACLSAEPRPTNKIFVIKDDHNEKDLPVMVELNFMQTIHELQEWLFDKGCLKFSLKDKTRFSKTSEVKDGKSVYKEIATDRYWYLDNFHKNHYEVFNSTRHHIGVADLDGILDTSKKVEGRRF
jgi:hypothetical protein